MKKLCLLTLMLSVFGCQMAHNINFSEGIEKFSNREYKKAYVLLNPLTEITDYEFGPTAKYAIADMLLNGYGIERNPERAKNLLLQVVREGDKTWSENAMFTLVRFYSGEFGDVPKHKKETYWENQLENEK